MSFTSLNLTVIVNTSTGVQISVKHIAFEHPVARATVAPVISLTEERARRHHLTKCKTCKGDGEWWDGHLDHAPRLCPTCDGTGKTIRPKYIR